jgi:hypothetical protein
MWWSRADARVIAEDGYVTTADEPAGTPAGQRTEPTPVAAGRAGLRRLLLIAAAAALLVAVAVVVVVTGDDNSPASRFQSATTAFRKTYDARSASLRANLAKAGGGVSDPGLAPVGADARALAAAYETYGRDVQSIDLPAAAQTGRADLVIATKAGTLLMTNVAGVFYKAAAEQLLNEFWPQVTTKLFAAEAAIRRAVR